MKALRTSVLLLFALSVSGRAVFGQSSLEAASLKGITAVGILVDGTEHNACGITTQDVKTSVKFIVGQSSLHINADTPFSIIVEIVPLEGCAATSIDISVVAPVTIIGTGERDYAARIWSKGGVMAGPSQGPRALERIESFCKQLVVDWNTANPK